MRKVLRRLPLLLLVILAVLAGCSSGAATKLNRNTLFVANTVAELLAGDLWDVTTASVARVDLRNVPANWPIVGLGTTGKVGRNGEIAVRGTGPSPQFLWADPTAPYPMTPLDGAVLPFLAVAACDPSTVATATATADQPLHAQVQALVASKGWRLAAVSVTGRFKDVNYSIAYNLLKGGTPLDQTGVDLTLYQRMLTAAPEAQWWFSGFCANDAAGQALLSIGGKIVHLHGGRDDLSTGGHLGSATVVNAQISAWPIQDTRQRQSDLTVDTPQLFGDLLSFTVRNIGTNEVTQVPVVAKSGTTVLWQGTLGALLPGTSRQVQTILASDLGTAAVAVTVDPDKQITESDETNNTKP